MEYAKKGERCASKRVPPPKELRGLGQEKNFHEGERKNVLHTRGKREKKEENAAKKDSPQGPGPETAGKGDEKKRKKN